MLFRSYRVTRHVYDATRKYYLLGRDRLIRQIDLPGSGRILEMGCGTGRNLIAAAEACPNAEIYGIDISEEMLKTARAQIAAAGLSDRITVAQADATAFDPQALFGVATFDRVFFSYTLSMIPDWEAAIRQGFRLLDPAGWLLIVDFGQGERLPGWFNRLLRTWLTWFGVEPRVGMKDVVVAEARRTSRSVRVERPRRGYAQFYLAR